MQQINEKFENLDPAKKKEIEEESELYIEKDPRNVNTQKQIKSANDKVQDRGPSAERNLHNLEK